MKLATDKIVIDEQIYPRKSVNEYNVSKLVFAHETGAKFPPLIVEAKTNRLVDGRHRYEVYKRAGLKTCEVTQKVYASEADLYADAVRLNIAHGHSLDQFDVRNSIIRLEQYGYKIEQISEIVRLPVDNIERIHRGFAASEDGAPLALKGGLGHMRGQTLTARQQEVNRNYAGGKATFYARQIRELLDSDMWPTQSESFITEMNRLTDAWSRIQNTKDKAA